MRSPAVLCLPLLALFASALPASATLLKGSQVTGVLTVDGETGNDFIPDTATVGPGIEFSAADESGGDLCEYTANISNAKIGIRDVCTSLSSTAAADVSAGISKPPFTITLTDTAFTGDLITPIKNGLDLTYTLVGDQLTFTFDDLDPTTNRSTFAVSAVTPEPASWQLLLLGLAGLSAVAYTSKSRVLSH